MPAMPSMRVLHVLDHSIPLHSGYTFRTRAILREQAKLGWQTFHLTSPKQGRTEALREEVTTIVGIAQPEDEVVARLESPGGTVHGYGLAASQLARLRDATGGTWRRLTASPLYAVDDAGISPLGALGAHLVLLG